MSKSKEDALILNTRTVGSRVREVSVHFETKSDADMPTKQRAVRVRKTDTVHSESEGETSRTSQVATFRNLSFHDGVRVASALSTDFEIGEAVIGAGTYIAERVAQVFGLSRQQILSIVNPTLADFLTGAGIPTPNDQAGYRDRFAEAVVFARNETKRRLERENKRLVLPTASDVGRVKRESGEDEG